LPQGAGFLLLPAQLLVVLSPLHHGTAELSPLHALFPLSRARRHSARQPRPRSQIQIDSDRPLLSPSAFRFEARPMQAAPNGLWDVEACQRAFRRDAAEAVAMLSRQLAQSFAFGAEHEREGSGQWRVLKGLACFVGKAYPQIAALADLGETLGEILDEDHRHN